MSASAYSRSRFILFGINSSEALILLVLGLVVIGPQQIASGLRIFRNLIAGIREFSSKARANLAQEIGVEQFTTAPAKLDVAPDFHMPSPRSELRQAVADELAEWARLGLITFNEPQNVGRSGADTPDKNTN